MKIGLDLHGVITHYPKLFSSLSRNWLDQGHEVHVITGKEWEYAQKEVQDLKVSFSHHFSIIDHHRSGETVMEKRHSGWWMDQKIWDASKGDYCRENEVAIHFDNDLYYAKWFPKTCSFILVQEGFDLAFQAIANTLSNPSVD